ncbi:isoaspartyl peptidase/L-asparaginase family protein [Campylobacter sp.]|uniref:isoaspartyl peptidase/L-asparaginase family protein n=1 Tax=Campylobacter sp. TaxID=205 RepID=UPI0036243232
MKHFSLSKTVFMAASLALLGLTAANAQEKFSPVIVIHGGTSGLDLTKEEFKIREEPMKKALLAGQAVLEKGGSAMDAVTAAIMVLEDDPNFNAGKGAVFTADGFNELDASIMDGSTKKAGAVAMARHIKNPILGARLAMDKTWHTLVAGKGADKLAKENGLEMVDQKYFFTQFRYDALQKAKEKQKLLLDSEKAKETSLNLHERPYLGTVGAIALDKNGNLAAATSTGGMTNKMTGRIGDSPIIGSGTYADNDSVAVSCTGTGDIYMRVNAAHEVSALYKYKTQDVQKAAEDAVAQVKL